MALLLLLLLLSVLIGLRVKLRLEKMRLATSQVRVLNASMNEPVQAYELSSTLFITRTHG